MSEDEPRIPLTPGAEVIMDVEWDGVGGVRRYYGTVAEDGKTIEVKRTQTPHDRGSVV